MDVVVDIDGTVADCSHRLHWLASKPKNWKAFHAGIEFDKPIHETIYVTWLLMKKHFYDPRVVFCTGRSESVRPATQAWFAAHMPWANRCKLYMRKDNDFRPDYVVKEELLAKMREDGYDPRIAFDDRDQVVAMWRRNGLICYQVQEGKY